MNKILGFAAFVVVGVLLHAMTCPAWAQNARQMTLDTGSTHEGDGIQKIGEKLPPEVITMKEAARNFHLKPSKRLRPNDQDAKKAAINEATYNNRLSERQLSTLRWSEYEQAGRNAVLQRIVIPRIIIRHERVESAIRRLESASREFDLTSVSSNKGYDVSLDISPSKANMRITFSASKITFGDALDAIASVAGLKYDARGRRVVVTDYTSK